MRKLRWEEIADGRCFHAALVTLPWRGGTEAHTHDFAEVMYVLTGRAAHRVNDTDQTLAEGHLVLIRAHDRHGIRPLPEEALVFINIAFSEQLWAEFLKTAGLGVIGDIWAKAPLPPAVAVPLSARQHAAGVFERALRAFHEKPTNLELIGFWVDALRLLREDTPAPIVDPGPEWLAQACRAMRNERNLREGLPRMLALSGVSPGHLSRSLRLHRGQTPTEFLNDLRLDRAALLLSTTPHQIIAISADCGFGSLSYFYRLFQKRFGETPAQHRARIRRSVVP